MLKNDGRYCDGCGQKLPPASRLSQQVLPQPEAEALGALGTENSDGTVTIDLCLNCRVARSNRIKHPPR
ncbi:MAG TPA: hypothetical protein VMB25_24095 [Bryobacteraceae bacterium]|nr:hypothetical protein [Bryobacteraceae bacterium]